MTEINKYVEMPLPKELLANLAVVHEYYDGFTIWLLPEEIGLDDNIDCVGIKTQRDEQQVVRLYARLERW